MTCLFRFEDTYAIPDFVRAQYAARIPSVAYNIAAAENAQYKGLTQVDSDLFVEIGCGFPQVLRFSTTQADLYKAKGIQLVIIFFDFDSAHFDPSGVKLLTPDEFEKQIHSNKGDRSSVDILDDRGISVLFAPIAYCAETFVLYNYERIGSLHAESLVSSANIVQIQQELLTRIYMQIKNNKYSSAAKQEIKLVSQYVSATEIANLFGKCTIVNRRVQSWFQAGCPKTGKGLFTYQGAIKHIKKVNDFVNLASNYDHILSFGNSNLLVHKTPYVDIKNFLKANPSSDFGLSKK